MPVLIVIVLFICVMYASFLYVGVRYGLVLSAVSTRLSMPLAMIFTTSSLTSWATAIALDWLKDLQERSEVAIEGLYKALFGL